MTYQAGDRVRWRGRPGTVQWSRNAPPDYTKPEAYSIKLDDVTRAGYDGTLVNANDLDLRSMEVTNDCC